MRRRSPQEKKRLSYAKDCRNRYGQNDKASRKSLPRKRAKAHRANRHHAHQDLHAATGAIDTDRADLVEQRMLGRRLAVFRKVPDTPLGEVVAAKVRRRAE